MALKAIKITKQNQATLASRFAVSEGDEDDVLPIGFWLTTEFGNDESFDVLTQDNFEMLFDITEPLKNEFHAIEAR